MHQVREAGYQSGLLLQLVFPEQRGSWATQAPGTRWVGANMGTAGWLGTSQVPRSTLHGDRSARAAHDTRRPCLQHGRDAMPCTAPQGGVLQGETRAVFPLSFEIQMSMASCSSAATAAMNYFLLLHSRLFFFFHVTVLIKYIFLPVSALWRRKEELKCSPSTRA